MARKKNKKSHSIKSAYNARLTGILKEFQALINDIKFSWTTHLSDREVRFIYDSVSRANIEKNYQLTDKQAKWGASILLKINAIKNS